MRGRTLVLGIAGVALVFGVALWLVQTRGWYVAEDGLARVNIAGQEVEVTDYRGLTGNSPLKLRGCFRLDPAAVAAVADAVKPTPLQAPGWFDCYDAATVDADLAAGKARALLAGSNETYGFDRVVAVYPDGRAFLWRQLNACGAADSQGYRVPDGCPPPPVKE